MSYDPSLAIGTVQQLLCLCTARLISVVKFLVSDRRDIIDSILTCTGPSLSGSVLTCPSISMVSAHMCPYILVSLYSSFCTQWILSYGYKVLRIHVRAAQWLTPYFSFSLRLFHCILCYGFKVLRIPKELRSDWPLFPFSLRLFRCIQ